MDSKKVSNNMLERMPVYLNYIKSLPKSTKNISATKIATALGLGEVSVRKDLAKVSDGGRCKLGYNCEELIDDIENFLDIKNTMNTIVAGKGELLQIVLGYDGINESGVRLLAGFDLNSMKKRQIGDKTVYPIDKMSNFCSENKIDVGIIMIPAEDAQLVCDQMIEAGVEAIWNFTPVHLNVPQHVVVQNENMITSVIKMRMQLKEKNVTA